MSEQSLRELLSRKKAVLLDYTGTMIRQAGADIEEMISRVFRHSDFASVKEALGFWFMNLDRLERAARGDSFRNEDELCLELLDLCQKEHGLADNHEELHLLNQGLWRRGPLYPDTAAFIESCPLPVYVLTNNAASYVEENLSAHGIHPAGIISAEDVRAYKPDPEIFTEAVRSTGCSADEIIHIGDSYSSDVLGARGAGIDAVLIDRDGTAGERDCLTVSSLTELPFDQHPWTATDYRLLAEQLRGFIETDPELIPVLSNASALLMETLPDINWAGFYLLREDTLVLGPFQGKPACIHIAEGRGVCGTAVSENRTVRVPDVHAFPGHIACDSASRSEIVVPLRTSQAPGGKLFGVLDIDSPFTGRFSEADQKGLEELTRILGESVTMPHLPDLRRP